MTTSSLFSDLLISERPAQGCPDLMLFGQFVGDWEFDYACPTRESGHIAAKGQWHFRWILEGYAIQDVWLLPRIKDRANIADVVECGTTIRVLDQHSGLWRIVWIGPRRNKYLFLQGRGEGQEIVIRGSYPDGRLLRWRFFNIESRRFSWSGETSNDGGASWEFEQRMEAYRV